MHTRTHTQTPTHTHTHTHRHTGRNIYVRCKVRIRTTRGYCCANLGSSVCIVNTKITVALKVVRIPGHPMEGPHFGLEGPHFRLEGPQILVQWRDDCRTCTFRDPGREETLGVSFIIASDTLIFPPRARVPASFSPSPSSAQHRSVSPCHILYVTPGKSIAIHTPNDVPWPDFLATALL